MAGTQKCTSVRIVFQRPAEFCVALGIGENRLPIEGLNLAELGRSITSLTLSVKLRSYKDKYLPKFVGASNGRV